MTSSGGRSLSLAVANRILELKRVGESDAEFGRRIGLTPQVLSNYRSRLHGASLDAVAAVAARTRVNLQWLLTGDGAREQVETGGPEPYIDGIREGTDRMLECVLQLRAEFGLPSPVMGGDGTGPAGRAESPSAPLAEESGSAPQPG
jgi:hypothetical protein